MHNKYKDLLEEYPFLTVINYAGNEYLGIMQNIDTQIASMYMYERIQSIEDKRMFLTLGEEWWVYAHDMQSRLSA